MPLILDENATCMGCGYRLANLPTQRCPECGRWFEPNDPTTYDNRWYHPRWRRWASAPSMKECLVFIVFSVYGVFSVSGPARWQASPICLVSIVGIPIWFGIIFVYFRRIAACYRDKYRASRDQANESRRPKWRWIVVPLCVLLVFSTIIHPWPLMLRFRLSQSAFETAVKEYQAGRRFSGGKWVGLYHVDYVEERTYFGGRPPSIGFVTGSSVLDPVGFEFDPVPGHPMGSLAMPVAPSWYTYED